MEEWVGQRWHRFIWRAADTSFTQAAVRLEQVQRAVQLLFRAGGGDPLVRVAPASAEKVGGPRGWLQKLAGQGERASVGTLDEQTLGAKPNMSHLAARHEVRALLEMLKLPIDERGRRRTNARAEWFRAAKEPLDGADLFWE